MLNASFNFLKLFLIHLWIIQRRLCCALRLNLDLQLSKLSPKIVLFVFQLLIEQFSVCFQLIRLLLDKLRKLRVQVVSVFDAIYVIFSVFFVHRLRHILDVHQPADKLFVALEDDLLLLVFDFFEELICGYEVFGSLRCGLELDLDCLYLRLDCACFFCKHVLFHFFDV